MHLLEFIPFFSVFLICVLGLGSFALALMVWRRRRMAMRVQNSWLRSVGRLLIPLGLLGSLAIILSLSLRTFFPRRGELFLRDTIVARADPMRGMPVLSLKESLEAGETLLTYQKPGTEAERKHLQILDQRLRTERTVLAEAPLELDLSLVREKQELATERRSLQQRLAVLELEQQRLLQQATNEILNKRVMQNEIRVRLGDYEGQIKKTESEIRYARLRLETTKGMHAEAVVSKLAYAEQIRNIGVFEADATRLATEQSQKKAVLRELEAGTLALQKMLREQKAFLFRSKKEIRGALDDLRVRKDRHKQLLTKERGRLERKRAGELKELDLQRADCQVQLRAAQDGVCVICPSDGTILYRHPSPSSAQAGEPIAMFGPKGAARARFKLSETEASRLEADGEIELLATSHELLTTKLSGRFVGSTKVAHEPGVVLAELACTPSESQMQFLSRGLNLDVRLIWAPPVLADPLMLLGILLISLSLLPSLFPYLSRISRLVKAFAQNAQEVATTNRESEA